jgi:peptidoglycan hydrolase-like protein with peptidoglycan-binding domain
MRYLLSRSGLILAGLAGAWILPAVAATPVSQTAAATTHKSTTMADKKSGTSSSHAPTATAKKSNTAPKTASSSTKKMASHSKSSSRKRSKKGRGQDAPTPERINEIQEALASKGAFSGSPTGKWDDSTVDAMKKFQSSRGLEPTGKLDALTLQKLGLGSQTAGLAAPVAPSNYVNRLHNTTSSPEEPQNQNE